MKLDEHSTVINPRRVWSAPPDRPVWAASGRASELAVPDRGAGLARERTTNKSARHRQVLTRFRARGAWLTRAALSTRGAPKTKFLSVSTMAGVGKSTLLAIASQAEGLRVKGSSGLAGVLPPTRHRIYGLTPLTDGAYGCLRGLFHDVSWPAEGPGRSLKWRHLSVQAFAAF